MDRGKKEQEQSLGIGILSARQGEGAHGAGGHGKAVALACHLSGDADLSRHSVVQRGEHRNLVWVKWERWPGLPRDAKGDCFLTQSSCVQLPRPFHPVAACAKVHADTFFAEVKGKGS